jgi:hypothetical protein
MTKCSSCGTSILFGGVRDANARYCNSNCATQAGLRAVASTIPPQEVRNRVHAIHGGSCPACSGPGPVDVHRSHRVFSLFFLTNWSSRVAVCCNRCGVKRKLGDAGFSLFLGWWGVPWGLVMTPIQIGRNLAGVFQPPNPAAPSADLEHIVRMQLAAGASRLKKAA